jgi:hypothetical protein
MDLAVAGELAGPLVPGAVGVPPGQVREDPAGVEEPRVGLCRCGEGTAAS